MHAADVHISFDRILLVLNALTLVDEIKYNEMHGRQIKGRRRK